MATKKDLVEAYSFSRRRLVTAFVSGAPGGREVEPARPGRSLIGGVALTVLLLAGGAIGGFFTERPGSDWKDPGLVRSKADGQNYIIFDYEEGETPVLRPVINFASAQLILGAGASDVSEVSEEDLKEADPGPLIGILGAPSPVPRADDLIQSGWTACTADGAGIRTNLAERPAVDPQPTGGFVVRANGATYLIAEAQERLDNNTLGPRRAYSYRLGNADSGVLTGLQIPTTDPTEVPPTWLRLFPSGGPLDASSIPIRGAGKPYAGPGSGSLPAGSRIGDYYSAGDLTLVLTSDGAAQLSDFARIVYLETATGKRGPQELSVVGTPDVPSVESPYRAARWPEGTLSAVSGSYCALLAPSDEVPVVLLGVNPTGDAALPEDLAPSISDPVVKPGFGALVRSGGFDNPDSGVPNLIDDRGFHYELVGPTAVENLGFGAVEAPVIPDSWLDLFQSGVPLSVDAALCPPVRDPQAPTCDQ